MTHQQFIIAIGNLHELAIEYRYKAIVRAKNMQPAQREELLAEVKACDAEIERVLSNTQKMKRKWEPAALGIIYLKHKYYKDLGYHIHMHAFHQEHRQA